VKFRRRHRRKREPRHPKWRTVLAVAHVTGHDLDELSGVGFARRLDLDVIAVLERRLAVAAVVRGHIGGRLN
jgi:hypothetical protein